MDFFLFSSVFYRILAASFPPYLRDGLVASQACDATLRTESSASLCVLLLLELSPLLVGKHLSKQADLVKTNLPLGRNYLKPTFT